MNAWIASKITNSPSCYFGIGVLNERITFSRKDIERCLGKDLAGLFTDFEPLSRGGMGCVFKIKADPTSKAYPTFLASIAACKKSKVAKELQNYREDFRRARNKLDHALNDEMDAVDSKVPARELLKIRKDIRRLKGEFKEKQNILLEEQTDYIEKAKKQWGRRHSVEELIEFLHKFGIDIPSYAMTYALKIPLRETEEDLKRLRQEWNSLILIDHPNLVTYLCGGPRYAFMEYIPDIIPPKDFISRFTVREKIDAVIVAADGLKEAHRYGVIHRDLKPDNIAVCESGHVKVIDFGLAKSEDNELSKTGVFIGTPYFAPPEQWDDMKKCDERTDIYSLGATLFYYLSEQPPFYKSGMQAAQIAHKVFNEYPEFPPAIKGAIDEDLKDIIYSMMAKEPEQRPQSIREAISMLEEYLKTYDDSVLLGKYSLSGTQTGSFRRGVKVRSRGRTKSTVLFKNQTQMWIGISAAVVCFIIVLVAVLGSSSGAKKRAVKELEEDAGFQKKHQELFDYAVDYARNNPRDRENVLGKFQRVREIVKGSKFEFMIDDERKKFEQQYKKLILDDWTAVDEEANRLFDSGLYSQARETYRNADSGIRNVYRDEIAERIAAIEETEKMKLNQVKAKQLEQEKQREAQLAAEKLKRERDRRLKEEEQRKIRTETLDRISKKAAELILASDFREAERYLRNQRIPAAHQIIDGELKNLIETVTSIRAFPESCEFYFEQCRGRKITIVRKDNSRESGELLKVSPESLTLRKEVFDRVHNQMIGTAVKVAFSDLSLEWLTQELRVDLKDSKCALCIYVYALLNKDETFAEKTAHYASGHRLYKFISRPETAEIPVQTVKRVEQEVVKPAFTGRKYYVAAGGLGSNPGTEDKPFGHPAQAAKLTEPGDVVYIKQGNYAVPWYLTDTGAEGKPVIYTADPENTGPVVFDGAGIKWGTYGGIIQAYNCEFLALSGLTVRNANPGSKERNYGILIFNGPCNGMTVENCTIENTAAPAIAMMNGINIRISGNDISRFCNGSGWGGIILGGAVENAEISSNYIHDGCDGASRDWGGTGIDLAGTKGSIVISGNRFTRIKKNAVRIRKFSGDILEITNNVFCSTVSPVSILENAGDSSEYRILNNTFCRNTAYGASLVFGGELKSAIILNNLFCGNSRDMTINPSTDMTKVVISHNLFWGAADGTGCMGDYRIHREPLFASIEPGQEDYRLKKGSPGIDAGLSRYTPETDINGTPRPQGSGVDVGAWEYCSN